MAPKSQFEKCLAEIHGLSKPTDHKAEEHSTDIRHAEFQAMADAFLGKGYDPTKLQRVEELQIALHKQQAELYRKYEDAKLIPEEYVDSVNNTIAATFLKYEKLLGKEDFLRLFGAPLSELSGLIDKEIFLRGNKIRVQAASLATASSPSQGWRMNKAKLVDRIARDACITKKAADL